MNRHAACTVGFWRKSRVCIANGVLVDRLFRLVVGISGVERRWPVKRLIAALLYIAKLCVTAVAEIIVHPEPCVSHSSDRRQIFSLHCSGPSVVFSSAAIAKHSVVDHLIWRVTAVG
jgi:hypothetical protein